MSFASKILDAIKFEFDIFLRNSYSIEFETLKIFEPKLCKLVSKLKPKLEKFIFLELGETGIGRNVLPPSSTGT